MTVSKFGELFTLWKLAANAKFQHNFSTIMPDRQKKLFIVSVVILHLKVAPGADFINLKLVIIKRIPYYRPTIYRPI